MVTKGTKEQQKKATKGNNNNKTGGSPVKSAFGIGKSISYTPGSMKKDQRHLWFLVEVQMGLLAVYIQKHNKDEEAFGGPFWELHSNNPEEMEDLKCQAIVYRKGVDGKTAKPQNTGTTYAWRQLIFAIGADNMTESTCMDVLNTVITKFNLTATPANYRYPRRSKLGGILSGETPAAVDTILLDIDVIGMMMAAYGHTLSLEEMKADEAIMAGFWQDVEHGAEVIDEHLTEFMQGGENVL